MPQDISLIFQLTGNPANPDKSSQPPYLQAAHGYDKRERILDAAQRVFSEKGFHNATVEEIAELASIGKGTVYLYFKSKVEILVSLIESRIEEIKALILQESLKSATLREKVRNIIAIQFDFYSHYKDFLRVFLSEIGEIRGKLGGRLAEARAGLVELIEGILKAEIEKGKLRSLAPRIIARALMGATNVVAFEWLVKENRDPDEECISQLCDFCLYGIAGDSNFESLDTR
ncbi:MAG: TetR/AcrR family transcriptional regulator [Firmicutes bacterium]|nr:TetR/AcrR family transcriptional regulator [Bacillota bacterium]